MHTIPVVLITLLACFLVDKNSTADSWGWSYSNYEKGSYVPLSGTFKESVSSGAYISRVYFSLDTSNVNNIKDYNNGGDNPGTDCDNKKAYLTLDQTADPNGSDLKISASAVLSNLPNPKYDLEDNDWLDDGKTDESEVVALGTVKSNKQYYMATYWDDYRKGNDGDGGNIQAQFGMSNKGWVDYNNCINADGPQVINSYGNNKGSL